MHMYRGIRFHTTNSSCYTTGYVTLLYKKVGGQESNFGATFFFLISHGSKYAHYYLLQAKVQI